MHCGQPPSRGPPEASASGRGDSLRLTDGRALVRPEEFVLSIYLALTNALADMAQMTGDPNDRARAEQLLAFIFSDHLFDGQVLRHDGTADGRRSPDFCSGCNLNALYLVDRIYGDTWKIDPLPALPERPDTWQEQTIDTYDLMQLHDKQPGTCFFEDFSLTVGYAELPPSGERARGALRLEYDLRDGIQSCTFRARGETAVIVPLDENDEVAYEVGRATLVEGTYDPAISHYTIKVGPSRDKLRAVRLVLDRAMKL